MLKLGLKKKSLTNLRLKKNSILGPKCVHMTRSVAKYAQVREFCQSLEIENEDGSKTKTGRGCFFYS